MPAKNPQAQALLDVTDIQQNLGNATDGFKQMNLAAKDNSTEVRNIVSLSTQLNNILKESLTLHTKIGKEYVDTSTIQNQINKFRSKAEEIEARIQTHVSLTSKLQHKQAISAFTNLNNTTRLRKEIIEINTAIIEGTAKGNDVTQLQNELLIKRNQLMQNQSLLAKKVQDINVRQLVMMAQQKGTTQQMILRLQGQLSIQEAYNQSLVQSEVKLGSLAALMKGIGRIPIIGNLIDTDKIIESMKAKLIATKSHVKSLGAGLTATMSEIGKVLADPLALMVEMGGALKFLVSGALEFDRNITGTSNNLGLSKSITQDIYKTFVGINYESLSYAKNLDKSLLSVSNQYKALNSLQEGFEANYLIHEQNRPESGSFDQTDGVTSRYCNINTKNVFIEWSFDRRNASNNIKTKHLNCIIPKSYIRSCKSKWSIISPI